MTPGSAAGVEVGQFPYVELVEATAVAVQPQGRESRWNLDGELLADNHISAQVQGAPRYCLCLLVRAQGSMRGCGRETRMRHGCGASSLPVQGVILFQSCRWLAEGCKDLMHSTGVHQSVLPPMPHVMGSLPASNQPTMLRS